MKKITLSVMMLTLSTSMGAQALGVDTLIKIMESDLDVITLSNKDSFRQFVNISVSDVAIVDGQLVTSDYTKENIPDWSMEVRPSKMILDSGQSKKVSLRYFGEPNLSHDKIYSVSMVPTPYYSEGEVPSNTVQMVIGVSPYVIKPAKEDQPLKYRTKYEGNHLVIKNLGDTYFRAIVTACDSVLLKVPARECVNSAYVLAGRELKIQLPERTKGAQIEVGLNTHSKTYVQKFNLEAGQVKSQ